MNNIRFLWCDVETTGLDPRNDLLLEVAVWPTRSADPFDLDPADKYECVVKHEGDALGKALSAATWKMHGKSGLLAEVVQSLSKPGDVMVELEGRLSPHCLAGGKWQLAGSSVHFDKAFLEEHLYRLKELIHYRVLDVTTVKTVAQTVFGMPAPNIGDLPHRAMVDVEASIRALRQCCDYIRGVGASEAVEKLDRLAR